MGKGKKSRLKVALKKDEASDAPNNLSEFYGLPPAQPQKKEAKLLSANVQKLRFMKIAEYSREQSDLKIAQVHDTDIQWCVAGYEDEVRAALKAKSKHKKSMDTSAIFVQARRSYGGINRSVEEAMKQISRRVEKVLEENEELEQAKRLIL